MLRLQALYCKQNKNYSAACVHLQRAIAMFPGQSLPLPLQLLSPPLQLGKVLLIPLPGAIEIASRMTPGDVSRLADHRPAKRHSLHLCRAHRSDRRALPEHVSSGLSHRGDKKPRSSRALIASGYAIPTRSLSETIRGSQSPQGTNPRFLSRDNSCVADDAQETSREVRNARWKRVHTSSPKPLQTQRLAADVHFHKRRQGKSPRNKLVTVTCTKSTGNGYDAPSPRA